MAACQELRAHFTELLCRGDSHGENVRPWIKYYYTRKTAITKVWRVSYKLNACSSYFFTKYTFQQMTTPVVRYTIYHTSCHNSLR